jgi:hypothetical protein
MDVYATIYQPCWKNCFQAACRSNQVEQGGFNAEIFNCIRFSKKRGKRTIIMNSDADNHSPLSDTTRERNSVSNVLYSSSNTTHSSRSTLFLTFSLVLLVGIAVFRWHRINDVPSGHDSAAHAEIAIHLANVFVENADGLQLFKSTVAQSSAAHLFNRPGVFAPFRLTDNRLRRDDGGSSIRDVVIQPGGFCRPGLSTVVGFSAAISPNRLSRFWKIALAFNLEISLLLTAAVAVALIDEAEKLSWRFTLPLAAVVLFLFSFSKMVVALLIYPHSWGGHWWTVTNMPEKNSPAFISGRRPGCLGTATPGPSCLGS